jgi:hypothetical protein
LDVKNPTMASRAGYMDACFKGSTKIGFLVVYNLGADVF